MKHNEWQLSQKGICFYLIPLGGTWENMFSDIHILSGACKHTTSKQPCHLIIMTILQ